MTAFFCMPKVLAVNEAECNSHGYQQHDLLDDMYFMGIHGHKIQMCVRKKHYVSIV